MTPLQQSISTIFRRTVVVLLIFGTIVGGAILGLIAAEVSSRDQLSLLIQYRPSTPTRLYDRNGELFAELFLHRQELVQLDDVPPHVVQAFLAVEDRNFYNHFGIDFVGIARAAFENLSAGRIVQGGSTLTQQLAKQIFLNHEGMRDRTYWQKIRETLLALQMEEELSKNEILEIYFNVIYLGHGCQGVACAAQLYFDKNVKELTLAEGALLARLPKAPVDNSPFRNPEQAKQQHRVVLQRMIETGYLDPSESERIHNDFWEAYWPRVILRPAGRSMWATKLDKAPFFTDYVRQMLEASDEIGHERLYTHGLRVYTTLDLRQQQIADEEMQRSLVDANRIGRAHARTLGQGGVNMSLFNMIHTLNLFLPVGSPSIQRLDDRGIFRKELEGDLLDAAELLTFLTPSFNENVAIGEFRRDSTAFLANLEVQGAFVSIEPRTGYITALIGGSEFSPTNQFNRAIQARRQPGSAFKVFVYGAGLETRQLSTASGINDAPIVTIDSSGGTWEPKNYDEGFRGMVPLNTAFALSLNTSAVHTYFKIGPNPIIDIAQRLLKITNPNRLSPDPAMALGSSEVTPMEMAMAMATIANDGREVIPFAVRYVTDQSGNRIFDQERRVRQVLAAKARSGTDRVIEPSLAYLLRHIMQHVADRGTATSGMRGVAGFRGEAAVKTGTTSSWSDAWTVGFNPEYANAVWFGFDRPSITLGPGQAGGAIASPLLGRFYRRYYEAVGSAPPSFRDRPDGGQPPPGVITGECGGLALAPGMVSGLERRHAGTSGCASDATRIYDQRELLMKEMGISPEELGIEDGRVKFRADGQ